MKQKNLLAKFEYKSYDLIGSINNQSLNLQEKNKFTLLKVKIDFAEGKLILQANRQFILQHTPHTAQPYLFAPKKRVQIQMDIFLSGVINLDDVPDTGLLLPLEGNIIDESITNTCTGVLVLKNKWYNKQDSNLWHLAFYIYDHLAEYDEIKFDLPLYVGKEFQMN